MKAGYGSCRRLPLDLFPLCLGLLTPGLLLAVALGAFWNCGASIAPKHDAATRLSFITLTPEAERQLLATARVAWRLGHHSDHSVRINLITDNLPFSTQVLTLAPAVSKFFHFPDAVDAAVALPVSRAAAPATALKTQEGSELAAPTFSREEMLRLD